MRWTDIHIRGVGAALGDLVPVHKLTAPSARHSDSPTGQRSISLARGRTGMDLAVHAGRNALASLAMTADGPLAVPDLHFHAAIWRGSRGLDFWSRAAYVRSRLGLPAGPGIATEINAMSNSLVGGLDLTARILAGSKDAGTVMLTGGETFGPPAFDHLSADRDIAYGDGGSALIIGREPGLAEVLATSSWSDPTLEQLHRGATRFQPPGTTEVGIETIRERKAHYTDTVGAASIHQRNTTGLTYVVDEALHHAQLEATDLTWVLLPHYGHRLLHSQCLQPLRLSPDRSLIHAGDQWGHVGPNDQLIGLTHLVTQHAVKPGDHVALIGIGIGMTWTASILRITTVPSQMRNYQLPTLHPWKTPTPPHSTNHAKQGHLH
ncbi:3-oxoacyl-[acyl-carrier-protein] synthase III C-terminal domain-containing protein [Amycolatopsis thailandensis]|uniref:3-oxoacyl-[acyl-carrier-protein] synthase III C-terminal domain-containing protein n=1 Tax=Amycolatopsis thailandensis TaxID=589330 RepID=UPI00362CB82C